MALSVTPTALDEYLTRSWKDKLKLTEGLKPHLKLEYIRTICERIAYCGHEATIYDLFGIDEDEDLSEDEVRKIWKLHSMMCHPDKFQDEDDKKNATRAMESEFTAGFLSHH